MDNKHEENHDGVEDLHEWVKSLYWKRQRYCYEEMFLKDNKPAVDELLNEAKRLINK